MKRTCILEGCLARPRARGLCTQHYLDNFRPGKVKNDCNIDGCRRKHEAHGLCNLHYRRWRRWGDPYYDGVTELVPKPKPAEPKPEPAEPVVDEMAVFAARAKARAKARAEERRKQRELDDWRAAEIARRAAARKVAAYS